MNIIKPLSPVPYKITGNRVIISQEIFTQLVEYMNTQTSTINTLIEYLQNLTNTVKQVSQTENDHYTGTVKNIEVLQNDTNASLDKLQNQVSTLAKSISIFLGGE